MQGDNGLIADALEHYGHDAQILKTLEELNELGAELMHFRDGKASAELVAGELADVIIMCEQMRLVFGADLVDASVREKLDRLAGRMGEEKDRDACRFAGTTRTEDEKAHSLRLASLDTSLQEGGLRGPHSNDVEGLQFMAYDYDFIPSPDVYRGF